MVQPDPPWLGDRRVAIIVNPAAHNALKPKDRQAIDEWLRDGGWQVEWAETKAAGEATELARRATEAGVPLVLVSGGDGTLNEAINGLAEGETTVGVIPAGTVNLWVRELGIRRKNPLLAAQQSVEGERRRIDLGRAGSRYFLSMAGYGIDAAVTAGVSERLKGVTGAAAYVVASFREAFRYRSVQASIDMDGEVLRCKTLMIIVSNTREYAGITQITPEAVVDDGLLDVRVFEGSGRIAIMLHALRVLFRLHRRARKVHHRRARRMKVTWTLPLELQLDGDHSPELVTEVSVAPQALWVAVPRGLKSPLFSLPAEP